MSKQSGERCRRSAVPGAAVCKVHGAGASQVRRKAGERVVEARAVAVFQAHSPNGDTAPVDVFSELADLVREVRAFRHFVRDRVSQLTAQEWSYTHPERERIAAEIALYERACDRAGRLLVDVSRLGIEDLERRAASQQALLEKSRAERIVAGLDEWMAALDLDDRQWELAPRAMAGLLLYLAGEDADAGPG
jgi:hypothetical protein